MLVEAIRKESLPRALVHHVGIEQRRAVEERQRFGLKAQETQMGQEYGRMI